MPALLSSLTLSITATTVAALGVSTSDAKPRIEHCDPELESCAKDVKPKIEHCDSESESCAKDL